MGWGYSWFTFVAAGAVITEPNWPSQNGLAGTAVKAPCLFKWDATVCGANAPVGNYLYNQPESHFLNQKWTLFTKDDNPNLGATDLDPSAGFDTTSAEVNVNSFLFINNLPVWFQAGRKSLLIEGDANGESEVTMSVQNINDALVYTWNQWGTDINGLQLTPQTYQPPATYDIYCMGTAQGSITASVGSVAVSGVNTNFIPSTFGVPLSLGVTAGDYLYTVGGAFIGQVASVTSATSLNLATNAASAVTAAGFKVSAYPCGEINANAAQINSYAQSAINLLTDEFTEALAPQDCEMRTGVPLEVNTWDDSRKVHSAALLSSYKFELVDAAAVLSGEAELLTALQSFGGLATDILTKYFIWKLSDGTADDGYFIETKQLACDWLGLDSAVPCVLAGCSTGKCLQPRTPVMFGDFFVSSVTVQSQPHNILAPSECLSGTFLDQGSDGSGCFRDGTGTLSFSGAGSLTVTGTNTNFVVAAGSYFGLPAPAAGNFLYTSVGTLIGQIASVTSATTVTLESYPSVSQTAYSGAFKYATSKCDPEEPAQCPKGWFPNLKWNYKETDTGGSDATTIPNPNRNGEFTVDNQCGAPVCSTGQDAQEHSDICGACPGNKCIWPLCKTSFDHFEMNNRNYEDDQMLWNNHGKGNLLIFPDERLWGTLWCGYGNENHAWSKFIYKSKNMFPPGSTRFNNNHRLHKGFTQGNSGFRKWNNASLYTKQQCGSEQIKDDSAYAYSNANASGYKGLSVGFTHVYPRKPTEAKKIKSAKWWVFRPNKCVQQTFGTSTSDRCFDQALHYVPGSIKAFSYEGSVKSQGFNGIGSQCTPQVAGHPSSWSCTSVTGAGYPAAQDYSAAAVDPNRAGFRGIEMPAAGAAQQRLGGCRTGPGFLDSTFRADFGWTVSANNRNVQGIWDRGLIAFTGANTGSGLPGVTGPGSDTNSGHPHNMDYPVGLNAVKTFWSNYWSVLLVSQILNALGTVLGPVGALVMGSVWPTGADPLTGIWLSGSEGSTRFPQMLFNNNRASGYLAQGVDERNCRQHDFCPLGEGESKMTCSCDLGIARQGRFRAMQGEDFAHKETGVFGPGNPFRELGWYGLLHECFNLKLKCFDRKGLKCVDWRLYWAKRRMNKYTPGRKEGKRLWGPVGRWDDGQTACTALRLPGEGNLKCGSTRVGNGVCDDDLNNEDWGFDGGDCCPSTCIEYVPNSQHPGVEYPGASARRTSCPLSKSFCCRQQGCQTSVIPAGQQLAGTSNELNVAACSAAGIGQITTTAGITTVTGANVNWNNTNFVNQLKQNAMLFTVGTNKYIGKVSGITTATSLTLNVPPTAAGVVTRSEYRSVKPFPAGTITATATSATITGVSTTFTATVKVGDFLFTTGNVYVGKVATIVSGVQLTLTANAAVAVTAAAFRVLEPKNVKSPVNAATVNDSRAYGATITTTTGSAVATGEGTKFAQDFKAGDHLFSRINGILQYVGTVASTPPLTDTSMSLVTAAKVVASSFVYFKAAGLQGTLTTTTAGVVTGVSTNFVNQVKPGDHLFSAAGYIGQVSASQPITATQLYLTGAPITPASGAVFYSTNLAQLVAPVDYDFVYSAWSACSTVTCQKTRSVTGCVANGLFSTVGCETVLKPVTIVTCCTAPTGIAAPVN